MRGALVATLPRGRQHFQGGCKYLSAVPKTPTVIAAVESVLEVGRQGFNEVVGRPLGIEVKRNEFENTSKEESKTTSRAKATTERVRDSSFWNPDAPNSPFVNRALYLSQFEELRGNAFDLNGACKFVPEEEIEKYVNALCEDGSLKGIRGLPSFLVPRPCIRLLSRSVCAWYRLHLESSMVKQCLDVSSTS